MGISDVLGSFIHMPQSPPVLGHAHRMLDSQKRKSFEPKPKSCILILSVVFSCLVWKWQLCLIVHSVEQEPENSPPLSMYSVGNCVLNQFMDPWIFCRIPRDSHPYGKDQLHFSFCRLQPLCYSICEEIPQCFPVFDYIFNQNKEMAAYLFETSYDHEAFWIL